MDPLVDLVLNRLFLGNARARAVIESLPGPMPRVQLAALKVSGGNLDRLEAAVGLARTDWRDLLISAEFAEDLEAHKQWVVADLHRLSIVKLNATDRLNVEAFRQLLVALSASTADARRAIALEAAECLRIHIEYTRSPDHRLTSLIDAFEAIYSN